MRLSICLFVALLGQALPLPAQEFLPTPFTAEEIRDAWQAGFEVTTRVCSAEGETYSRTEVLEWTEEGFRMSDRGVSESGLPLDEDVSYYSGSWEELRDHAKFPISTAIREPWGWPPP